MRRALHHGAGDVDGVTRADEATGGAARTVTQHDAAVELDRAVQRERRAATAVEALGVLHHPDRSDDGILRGGSVTQQRIPRLERASQGLVDLAGLLGAHLVEPLAGTAMDDEQGPVATHLDDLGLARTLDLASPHCSPLSHPVDSMIVPHGPKLAPQRWRPRGKDTWAPKGRYREVRRAWRQNQCQSSSAATAWSKMASAR